MALIYEATELDNGQSYQDMYALLFTPEFRQPCEMCIRRQAVLHAADAEKPYMVSLAYAVLSNYTMDIEAILTAVASHKEGHTTIGNDKKMFELVDEVWPIVAAARYPGVVAAGAPTAISMTGAPLGDGTPVFPPPTE